MTKVLPSVADIPAGSIVTASELNAVGSAMAFLLDKPQALIEDTVGAQTVTNVSTGTKITFATKIYDTDGMYSSGATDRLTIQTPGYYKVNYNVDCVSGTPLSLNAWVLSTTGPNNPQGAGVTGQFWPGYMVPQSTVGMRVSAGGLWPQYLWPGDFLSLFAYAATNTSTTSNTNPSYLAVEWMSI